MKPVIINYHTYAGNYLEDGQLTFQVYSTSGIIVLFLMIVFL